MGNGEAEGVSGSLTKDLEMKGVTIVEAWRGSSLAGATI